MARKPTLMDRFMAEYIPMGGPVLTRAEAYRHLTALGVDPRARDYACFARKAVDPPADPEAEIAFAHAIEERENAR